MPIIEVVAGGDVEKEAYTDCDTGILVNSGFLDAKYFGPQGELFKKRQSLIKPIQDDVYNAVKKVSEERGFQVIFDRASSQSIVFASPRIDVSNEVLGKLGYAK